MATTKTLARLKPVSAFKTAGASIFEQTIADFGGDVYMKILRYVEGDHIVGPSLHSFKLSMLSTKMYNFVTKVYGVSNFTEFAKLYAKQ